MMKLLLSSHSLSSKESNRERERERAGGRQTREATDNKGGDTARRGRGEGMMNLEEE